jgi:high affinity Mn2+ porin
MLNRLSMTTLLVCLCGPFAGAQDGAHDTSVPVAIDLERWNLYWQATSIGQYHGSFPALYGGPLSLSDKPERDVSLTTTVFFGLRITDNTQLYFDPEIAGGKGFSNVDGLANASNGERESVESDENQLGGSRPETRYTIVAGRFTLTDYFDNNDYTHDPRTQFLGWAVMYNGAWDYPADTRGYTWGWVHEFHTKRWSLRYASAAEPKVANGGRFDRRLFRDRGDVVEGEIRYHARSHPGVLRLLSYMNHTDSGSYGKALQLAAATHTTPDINNVLQVGTLKYGFGVNVQQEIVKNVGVFSRLGWNDGKTEDFAFTAIDRLATGGVSVSGKLWNRPEDTLASEFTASGLSAVHALYLERGGLDFLIGDGGLNYRPEYSWETYYNARILKGFFAALDAQHIANPAYNHDRGPLWAYSLRLHVEYGKK